MNLAAERPEFKLKPSEYFRRQVYGCYWFEKQLDQVALDAIGTDNILFETDFPHPTCLYPDGLGRLTQAVQDRSLLEKITSTNAARIYKL